MLRVPITQIKPGMVLARPIPQPNDPHRYLVQRDREIPFSLVPRLLKLGVLEVWVRHRNLEFLEDVIDEGVGDRQRGVYWHVRRNFESIMNDAACELEIDKFQSSISDLFDSLKRSSHGSILLQKLDAFDNVLLSHSTNVCYLALLLGMKLEQYLIDQRSNKSPREAKDLKDLGLGCILHDVGKMRIPPEILNKPGKLTAEEMELMKQHPVFGYEMVKGQVSASAAQVVLNHHQRFCGGGYPERRDRRTGELLPSLRGRQIPVFCRLATICDVYDAATTKRCYSDAKPPVQVLHEMRTWCSGHFDPVVERAFRETIPAFPIGQTVTLSTGMEAVVVDFNPHHPERPKVQGIRSPGGEPIKNPPLEEIDLAFHTDTKIVAAQGVDVREFLEAPVEEVCAAAAV
jgi:HD-GYP domain-containing protein (c-di-GMP phosphodiesterase class II)